MCKRAILLALIVSAAIAQNAQAAPVLLSDLSSDNTPADLLNASFDFSVDGSELIVVVSNLTGLDIGDDDQHHGDDDDEGASYEMTSLYFNARNSVADLQLRDTPGWKLGKNRRAGPFGEFRFNLKGRRGRHGAKIENGEQQTFLFNILGNGPFSETDFLQSFSKDAHAGVPTILAARFEDGPNHDSAFGAAVPEPSSLVILIIGGVALGRPRRMRRLQRQLDPASTVSR